MLRARGGTKLSGLLGWPLETTLSPAMQNAAFRARGLDWVYLVLAVHPDDLAAAVTGLRVLGAMGLNVTMPHKESVVPLLDALSGDARALGAVNTVQRVGDRLVGHNTDLDGFREFLRWDAGLDVAGKRAVVVGAGGAARAIVTVLDELGTAEISVAARRVDRGRAVARLARNTPASAVEWGEASRCAERAELVVNATPLGREGEDPVPAARFGEGHVVIDLLYDPPSTRLVERARAEGARAWGGLGMLVRQGAASFRIWTGQDPPVETMSAAALRALDRGA
jgi:shikimate dehydrogenase